VSAYGRSSAGNPASSWRPQCWHIKAARQNTSSLDASRYPASEVARIFPPMQENPAASENWPTGRPWMVEPCAWLPSSITASPRRRAIRWIAGISAGWP
jgi:hypothetical protein